MDDQRVYMTHFYDSAYGSTAAGYPNPSTYTYVFNGSVTWSGPGWTEITLTTPFNYDPSWGIEIFWENRDGSRISGPPQFRYTETDANTAVYKYSNTSFPTTSGTRYKKRPNIWFMTPTIDPPSPAAAVAPANEAQNIAITTKLTWNHTGGSPTGYRLWFGSNNPPSDIAANFVTTSTSYTPPAYLDYDTEYFWRVVPYNEYGNAIDCPVWSFRTLPDPSIVDYPYLQSFEGSFNPSGWTDHSGALADPITLGADGSSQWSQDDWLNINNGDKAARINIWGSVGGYLISPLFNIPSDDYVLEFDAAMLKYGQTPSGTPPNYLNPDDRFAVLIGDGFTWSTANIVREYNNSGSEFVLNDIPTTGTRVSIPLADHTGRIKVALFAGSSTSNAYNDIMFNNFRIGLHSAQPQAPLPSIAIHSASGLPRLNWGEVPEATIYHIFKADSPYGLFSPLGSTSSTYYPLTATSAKAFFKITAE